MRNQTYDAIVIGGGIAGASIAAELAAHLQTLLIEAEAQLGYHASGRSAALYIPSYGNSIVRNLTIASRDFLHHPPAAFGEGLTAPRGALYVGANDSSHDEFVRSREECGLERWPTEKIIRTVPILRPEAAVEGFFDACAEEIDTGRMLQGYVSWLRSRGGTVRTGVPVDALEFSRSRWRLRCGAVVFESAILVNAGGAWADHIAAMAGLGPIGLEPKRRTVILVDAPSEAATSVWPAIFDNQERWYFKPEAGRILASPADETPSLAVDAQAEEHDVAVIAAQLEAITYLSVARIQSRWAGLRTFAPDRSPVVGFDPRVDGFFWFAGQGGYGFQMAPALARCGMSLLLGERLCGDLSAPGINSADIDPARLL
jgi:D-arginine dehydrogenase